MSISSSFADLSIGTVFTPRKWARFAESKFQILDKWLSGKTVFDPTMGEGDLLFTLIELGLKKGIPLENLPTENLYGVELNKKHFENFRAKWLELGLAFQTANFQNTDILFFKNPARFDLIFGNPPWQNFVDLPEAYKAATKSLYFEFDLVGNAQDLLLGGSRIDIAALVIQKTIRDNLKTNGEAVFFMPLSLLLNDGANKQFRTYRIRETQYSIREVFDFGDEKAFENVSTRYGLVHLQRDEQQIFPISYKRMEKGIWQSMFARPLLRPTDPLSITETATDNPLGALELLVLQKENMPRQGLNTCGANVAFFFDSCENNGERHLLMNGEFLLPKKYVHPLITGKNFKNRDTAKPNKWVLIPHNPNGKPLEWSQIKAEPCLLEYLSQHRAKLESRKGTLINVWIEKGYWWALLGVGEYNYFPSKVVWEAYGKSTFNALVFEGHWQANQSLQCFIPVKTDREALRVSTFLSNPEVEKYLLSLKMEGTMNWAQPGKIKKLLHFEDARQLSLGFDF